MSEAPVVELVVRPRWRRALMLPHLYRAHRRLGLGRLVAWRLAWSVMRGKGGPVRPARPTSPPWARGVPDAAHALEEQRALEAWRDYWRQASRRPRP